jgi:ABC-type glycerol-3-phosphate transport system permease component
MKAEQLRIFEVQVGIDFQSFVPTAVLLKLTQRYFVRGIALTGLR